MSEKRLTLEEIDAETDELLQRTLDLKEKVNSDSVKKAKKKNAKPKIRHNGVTYNSLVEAKEATGLSRHLLTKNGELLRND